jgi:hypothetical protein
MDANIFILQSYLNACETSKDLARSIFPYSSVCYAVGSDGPPAIHVPWPRPNGFDSFEDAVCRALRMILDCDVNHGRYA